MNDFMAMKLLCYAVIAVLSVSAVYLSPCLTIDEVSLQACSPELIESLLSVLTVMAEKMAATGDKIAVTVCLF